MASIHWGVLSTAKIGVEQVIPAMQQGKHCKINAIASRSIEKAKNVAESLGIPKAYGSYSDLLQDPEIDAIYNPLPNHLHVPWSIKALEAGKHVLCEKPIGLSVEEAQTLLEASRNHPDLIVMEAFMYRFHPQWQRTKALVDDGTIGRIKTIQSFFSYFNDDPNNIRNKPDIGGGGLMDIGCYCISLARFLFDTAPDRVMGYMEIDPDLHVDRLTSGILHFAEGTSTFTCSTQLAKHQRVKIFGTGGNIEIEIPFNAPADESTRIWLHKNRDMKEIVIEAANQYTIQGDLFSEAVTQRKESPTPLSDAIANMKVIEAIVKSSETNSWASV